MNRITGRRVHQTSNTLPAKRGDSRSPRLKENLWGYGKRLRFVDETIVRAFPAKERSELTVLDVGCGNGSQLTIPLAKSGYLITGVDPHEESIQLGRSLAPRVAFHHGVVTDLSLQQFDCIILSEVLEHLAQPQTVLEAALSYLSSGGIVIVTVPNGYGEFELDRRLYQLLHVEKLISKLRARAQSRQTAGSLDNSPHIQRFTVSGLCKLFARNGLQLIEARGTSFASGPFVGHLFGKSETFIQLNARLADHLPLPFVAGWMFSLRRS